MKYRHYVSMDLYGNGIGYNIVIMKEDANGDIYYIKEENLDEIDKKRMRQILSKRNADQYPLWDLMSQTTLKNGMNALEYFHQLVQVRTASGQIISPSSVRHGMRQPPQPRPAPRYEGKKDTTAENTGTGKKGPGRPPKKAD